MVKTYLAFDYGSKRTGLAVGNDLLRTTQALPALATAKDGKLPLAQIQQLIKEWKIAHLIFGAPLGAEGEATAMSKRIAKLGRSVAQQCALPVDFIDERYTSSEADRLLREQQQSGKKLSAKKIALRDSLAAELILQSYFKNS